MTKKKKPKKFQATPEMLANDPSLQWFPYKPWELLWSDELHELVRFRDYTISGKVRIATVNGIADRPELLDALKVHRPRPEDPT